MTIGRPAVAGIDIDGVLSDPGHRLHHVQRRPKNWRAFFRGAHLDPPLPEGIARTRELHSEGLAILYVSGRPEFLRTDTERWLGRHDLPEGPLVLRPAGDHRPAKVLKRELYAQIARQFDVVVILDDDAEVVAALRDAGLPAQLADWFDPAADQRTLTDAQESEGRT